MAKIRFKWKRENHHVFPSGFTLRPGWNEVEQDQLEALPESEGEELEEFVTAGLIQVEEPVRLPSPEDVDMPPPLSKGGPGVQLSDEDAAKARAELGIPAPAPAAEAPAPEAPTAPPPAPAEAAPAAAPPAAAEPPPPAPAPVAPAAPAPVAAATAPKPKASSKK